jgi:hypothetical protein
MESNDRICEASIQTHTRCQRDRHVGEETHVERCQGRNCSSARDEVLMDDTQTEIVFCIICTSRVIGIIASASSTAVCQDGCVDLLLSAF